MAPNQETAREGGLTVVWTMDTHAWLDPVLDQPGTGRSQPEPAARLRGLSATRVSAGLATTSMTLVLG
jgi:hypothetical protein